MRFLHHIRLLILALAVSLHIPATAEVSLEDHGDSVTLRNGSLSATVSKSSAALTSLWFEETEFILPGGGNAYYSMDGGKNYRRPSGCTYRIHSRSDDHIDIALLRKWNDEPQAVDIEIHYVITTGLAGIYSYAILSHPEDYPRTSIGEWRMVWKLPADLLDTIAVDSRRHWEMPSSADYARAEPTGIKEITKINTGPRAGRFDCKYDFNAVYHDTPFWGHYDKDTGLGAWMVFGAHEWFNDGPTKQDLTSAANILHVHFGMNHYNGSGTRVAAGEKWEKVYGPFLLYLNHFPGSPVRTITDAKRQAETEAGKWPYPWVKDIDSYPMAENRGTVSGTLAIDDPAKPLLTAANARIGLAQPDPGGNWQFESKRYQYWTRAKSDGSFEIPHVRPGTYTLYAFTEGAVGEFEKRDVKVTAGTDTAVGTLSWSIPRDRGEIVWEIGTPDRTAAEFRHGDDYFQGYLWARFNEEWPNPLEYTIGESIPSKDWNYAQSVYPVPGKGFEEWPWKIRFNLPSPPSADATLTLAFASADSTRLSVSANGEEIASFLPAIQGGNALLREGIHAKYSFSRIPIPADKLVAGENIITLVQTRTQSPASHVMYDYLSLEVPETTEDR